MKNSTLIFILIQLNSLSFLVDAATTTSILEDIKPYSITIIGESHQHSESVHLFQQLVIDSLTKFRCVTVGLEIASNQQTVIDSVMAGKASVDDIKISTITDHPAMRKMIEKFVSLKLNDSCINLIALDAGDEIDSSRDRWMAIKIMEQKKRTPFLILLGALHTLKKVVWDKPKERQAPYVAEILVSIGFNVKTYPQRWKSKYCGQSQRFTSRYIPAKKPEALSLLNNSIFNRLNAFSPKTAIGVIDGLILWECSI